MNIIKVINNDNESINAKDLRFFKFGEIKSVMSASQLKTLGNEYEDDEYFVFITLPDEETLLIAASDISMIIFDNIKS